MGIASKGVLILNTVKYLKPRQLVNQVIVRLRKKETFWNYRKSIEYKTFELWIDGLDNNSSFMQRFSPEELLEGRITLLNESRIFNKWNYEDASHLWNFNIHYLEYLIPLYSMWKESGNQSYKDKINEILDWWYKEGSNADDSNHPYTISLRVINQLMIEDSVDDKQKLFESIYAQYRYLLKHQEKHLLGNHYLENLKAIVICSLVFSEDDVYKKYIQELLAELDEQITPDGLQFELSHMYHKIILEDLIRVAFVLREAEKKEYKQIVKYITRMASALYSIEYGISRTPLFNDAGDNIAKTTDSLLNACNNLFNILIDKKDSIAGYHKLYDDNITVLVDCGKLSSSYMPGHAHCDCLSFELFLKGKPVFVNCGTYQYQGKKRKYFRSTKAHNTVMINGHEQSELWGEHRAARRIRRVIGKRAEYSVMGSYYNYYGEKHSRKIRLKENTLDVIDITMGDTTSYLHLAPGLKYENSKIKADGLVIEIIPLNSKVDTEKMLYSDCFGKVEEIECIVFSWESSAEKHGYRIRIIEEDQND